MLMAKAIIQTKYQWSLADAGKCVGKTEDSTQSPSSMVIHRGEHAGTLITAPTSAIEVLLNLTPLYLHTHTKGSKVCYIQTDTELKTGDVTCLPTETLQLS